MNLLSYNREQIQKIVLSKEEEEAAIYEGILKKFFKERNKDYWHEQEFPKDKKNAQADKTVQNVL